MENGHDSHPLSTFGTPIANSTRSLLSPRPGSSSSNHSTGSSSVSSSHRPLIQRLKGQDLYGGPVKFGGGNASNFFKQRRERLNAASPYASSKRRDARKGIATSNNTNSSLIPPNHEELHHSNAIEKGPSSHSIAPSDAMSSTAKLILDTLERMSTPLRDARKIPVNPSPADMSRAEKRRLIAEELDSSLLGSPGGNGMKRKRPNLSSTGSSLSGPPVRTFFSPVLNRTKKSIQQESPKRVPGEIEKKDQSESPKASLLPNGAKDLPSIASSIEAFKKTVDSSHSYGETSNNVAGGKLRIKDTMGPRSGRTHCPTTTITTSSSSCLPPVKTPSVESNPLLSNGWTLPSSTKSPISEKSKPTSPPPQITPKLPLAPPSPPRIEEKKIPATIPILPPLESSLTKPPAPFSAPIAAAKPIDSEVSQVFNFSEPKKVVVSAKSDLRDEDLNDILFTFSNPKILAEEPKHFAPPSLMVNGHEPIRKLPDITSFPSTTTPSLKAVGSVPSILVGSKGLLPDITAVPGQLKKGSVLSALSKMHDTSESKNARL